MDNKDFLDSLPEEVLLVFFLMGSPFPRYMLLASERFRKAFLKKDE